MSEQVQAVAGDAAESPDAAADAAFEKVLAGGGSQDNAAAPKSTETAGTETKPAPSTDQAGKEQFRPSRKQIDAAKELGVADDAIDRMTEHEAKAYERARSLSSKQQGKLAREMAAIREQLATLGAQPDRGNSASLGAGSTQTAFAPPDDVTLTELFGDPKSAAARSYKAALDAASQVPALVQRLDAYEQGANGERTRQQLRTVNAFFDGLDTEFYPDFGKTDALIEDSDEDAARSKVYRIATRLMQAGDGDEGMALDEAMKSALNAVRPDALARQAEAKLRKEILARDGQRIATPSQRAIPRAAKKDMTDAERDEEADAAARELGIIP